MAGWRRHALGHVAKLIASVIRVVAVVAIPRRFAVPTAVVVARRGILAIVVGVAGSTRWRRSRNAGIVTADGCGGFAGLQRFDSKDRMRIGA